MLIVVVIALHPHVPCSFTVCLVCVFIVRFVSVCIVATVFFMSFHPDVTSSFAVCLVCVLVVRFVSVCVVTGFVMIVILRHENNEFIPGKHTVTV